MYPTALLLITGFEITMSWSLMRLKINCWRPESHRLLATFFKPCQVVFLFIYFSFFFKCEPKFKKRNSRFFVVVVVVITALFLLAFSYFPLWHQNVIAPYGVCGNSDWEIKKF